MLAALAISVLLRLLLHASPAVSAVVPPSLTLTSSIPSLGLPRINPDRCNQFPDWIGDGILDGDCRAAINELYHDDVAPRRGQTYEFLRRGVGSVTDNPWVTTPRKHWYKSCTVVIAMLNQFVPGTLPGEPPFLPTTKSDVATFDQLYDVANTIFSQCVFRVKPLEHGPYAGWSFAGSRNSIGVFIIRNHGELDNNLVRDQMRLTSTINSSSTINGSSVLFMDLPKSPTASKSTSFGM